MTPRFRESRQADALQKALERHQRLLAGGADPAKAGKTVFAGLDPKIGRLFGLAVGLAEATTPAPEPDFAEAFAQRLATVQLLPLPAERARRRLRMPSTGRVPGFGYAAAAAAIAIFAGILVPAFRSLPGDSLYALKRASEAARVGVVSGPREARVRLSLASERFEEVEGLVERAQTSELSPGIGAAPAAQDIKDPRIAELIRTTLQDAQEQIQVAAEILIEQPRTTVAAADLDDLLEITTRGRQLAEAVVEDLPETKQSRVFHTVVRLAKIEAEAKAARMKVEPEPLKPCDTPTPTPTPSPTPSAPEQDGASPTPFVSPSPTPSPQPTTRPSPTPCISPTPSPTPDPTVAPTPETTSAPTATSQAESQAGQQEPQSSDSARGSAPAEQGNEDRGA